ncbi:MAG: ABC transporter permease [Chlamydiota bacterium]
MSTAVAQPVVRKQSREAPAPAGSEFKSRLMNWTRLRAILRKEVIQIRRDSRSLAIVVAMPVVLMLLFGYGVSLDIKPVQVCVLDREGSQQSQDLARRFAASEYFTIAGVVDNYPALVQALDRGRAQFGLVIPYDFSQRLRSGTPVDVQLLVDATDDNTANVVIGYAQAVVRGFSRQIQMDWLNQRGQPAPPATLQIQGRTWFNENLESRAFIIPGVVALVMAVIGTFLTSLTIAREWERGTMEQLISTPVTPLELMLGKLIPYFLVGLLDTAICTAMAIWLFQVPFRGSWAALFAVSALFMTVVLAMGYLISVIAKNQLTASQLALVTTFLPAFLLSGFLFTIDQMPAALQVITHVIPARYYVAMLKGLFLKGLPLRLLLGDWLPLCGFALFLSVAATRAFRKKLA